MLIDVVKALPTHPEKSYSTRKPLTIDTIVIHHAAADTNPFEIARWHIQRGWPGIGYHSVIMEDGRRWKCNNDSTISYHVKGNNIRSVGICIAMDLTHQTPSYESHASLIAEVFRYATAYGVPTDRIYGHGELNEGNECPGQIDVDDLREIISLIRR